MPLSIAQNLTILSPRTLSFFTLVRVEYSDMVASMPDRKRYRSLNFILVYRDFRPKDVRHSQADISKAAKLIGYAPTHTIGEGLEEAMDWYVNFFNH